jgi:Fe2+ transport system protein FeoA
MMSLINAPADKRLKIVGIFGGHGIHRKLLSLGFHKNDIIELDSKTIFKGPVLVTDVSSGTSVALGRGIAQKIMVEIVGDKK